MVARKRTVVVGSVPSLSLGAIQNPPRSDPLILSVVAGGHSLPHQKKTTPQIMALQLGPLSSLPFPPVFFFTWYAFYICTSPFGFLFPQCAILTLRDRSCAAHAESFFSIELP
jgi:hypothetical protein